MTTDTFTFNRDFGLSPAQMWHLMTDPAMREKWGAPGDAVLNVVTADLRIDGQDHHRCGPVEAPDFEVRTRWYNLEEPHAASFTEVIEAGGMRLGASLVTYAIDARDTGSKVSITVHAASFVGAEMIAEFHDGWSGGFDKLAALADRQET